MAVNRMEYAEQMQGIQQEIEKLQEQRDEIQQTEIDPRARLVVFGLLNSGKSTLLNVLTDHLDEELFKTGDFRVTTSNQVYETDDMIFVDTPGMDGGDSDDILATLGVSGAHIILFLHNADHELEHQEIELLQLDAGAPVNGRSPVMILMSRADSLSKNEVEQVRCKIMEQCQELLNTEFMVLPISALMYMRGLQESDPRKKNLFLEYSNIDKLKALIEQYQSNIDPVAMTQAVKNKETARIQEKITLLKNELAELQALSQPAFIASSQDEAREDSSYDEDRYEDDYDYSHDYDDDNADYSIRLETERLIREMEGGCGSYYYEDDDDDYDDY